MEIIHLEKNSNGIKIGKTRVKSLDGKDQSILSVPEDILDTAMVISPTDKTVISINTLNFSKVMLNSPYGKDQGLED